MATIGDYIHFKTENYQQFGTYRSDYSNDGSSYSSAQSVYNQQKTKMLNIKVICVLELFELLYSLKANCKVCLLAYFPQ